MAKDRFTWDWEDVVMDLNIPEGKVHTMLPQGDAGEEVENDHPTMTELSGGIEKDQYAEIAERDVRFGGEHNTPMSSGNVQADMDEKDGDDMVEKVTPEGNETRAIFMDRCIHNLISEGKTPQKSADQCYAIWNSSKGTSRKAQDPEMVKMSALMRLVFKGAINVAGLFVRKPR